MRKLALAALLSGLALALGSCDLIKYGGVLNHTFISYFGDGIGYRNLSFYRDTFQLYVQVDDPVRQTMGRPALTASGDFVIDEDTITMRLTGATYEAIFMTIPDGQAEPETSSYLTVYLDETDIPEIRYSYVLTEAGELLLTQVSDETLAPVPDDYATTYYPALEMTQAFHLYYYVAAALIGEAADPLLLTTGDEVLTMY